MSNFTYIGSELELFACALNWKSYWSKKIQPFVHGDVLEMGAGIGANTLLLDRGVHQGDWVCLEPDASLLNGLSKNLHSRSNGRSYETVCGTIASLPPKRQFDSILYIDVLEHIEADAEELASASSRLRPGGHLVVLSPAHNWLFAPFDKAIGHFRRYDRSMMHAISPAGLRLQRLMYLDSAGLLASLGNRLFLKQSMPTAAQLRVWDRCMVPISRITDRLLFHFFGKTIVGIWTKPWVETALPRARPV